MLLAWLASNATGTPMATTASSNVANPCRSGMIASASTTSAPQATIQMSVVSSGAG